MVTPDADTEKLIDGRKSVCVGHISDCDCLACRTVRRALRDVSEEARARRPELAPGMAGAKKETT